jgi:hypothetical protein
VLIFFNIIYHLVTLFYHETCIEIIHLVYSISNTYKSSENHILLTVTPNLVVLEPTISLRHIDHYYSICAYVWCDVNFAYTMFVCIATTSSDVMSH